MPCPALFPSPGIEVGPALQLRSRRHSITDKGVHDPNSVGDVLTHDAAPAGLGIRPTGHSPRRGLVTESKRAGHDDRQAGKQGGWAPGSPLAEVPYSLRHVGLSLWIKAGVDPVEVAPGEPAHR